ncbi:antitoxin VapB family protein [Halegenticoccus soli]|uniref:antitoxin VapB family protein n=1 Tax=Halegenticoccus soli TaxID=1985678 RepID=UPI000C6E240F|nr:antitoxin VapB family protein [Halegenticoccus soli]
MGSKTISVKDETYRRLAREKREGESFSDVIDRLVGANPGDNPLRELVGLADEEEIKAIREASDEFRNDLDEQFDRRGT